MQSKATTVAAYLASLPSDRRAAVEAVRRVVLDNIDRGFAEGMQYGMIGYYVPHAIFPPGYHCDPKQPLPFAGLASQKQHLSLYIMGIYGDAALREWFVNAWKATGKKLDMGKACIRFKKVEDVPLEVIGEAFRRISLKGYIAAYERNLAMGGGARAESSSSSVGAKKKGVGKKSVVKKKAVASKVVKKPVAKSAAKKVRRK
jgi:hypothetical protein